MDGGCLRDAGRVVEKLGSCGYAVACGAVLLINSTPASVSSSSETPPPATPEASSLFCEDKEYYKYI